MDKTLGPSAQSPASTLDVIVYLASLVSRPEAIDSLLDEVRIITSRHAQGDAMTAHELQQLGEVRQRLEDYLIHQEPLRAFTAEVLEQRVKDHFESRGRRVLRKTFVASLSISIIAFVAPFMLLAARPLAERTLLSMPAFLIAINASIIWFYWSALRDFSVTLKRAYLLICLGIFIIGINGMQLPLMYSFGLADSPWFRYGAFMPPFPVACFLMYLGIRQYALLTGVKSRFSSLPLMAGLSVIAALVAAVLPHTVAHPTEEFFFDMSAISSSLTLLYLSGVSVLAFYVHRTTAPIYSTPTKWFFWMAVILAGTTLEYTVVMFAVGQLNGVTQMLAMLPFIGSEYCKLRSGYTFKRANSD